MGIMVLNATFNNILGISWWSVLLVEETGAPREKHRPSVGPYIVDTTKPKFYGQQIDVRLVNNYLIANWSANAFQDSDDPYPMKFFIFRQKYELHVKINER
jgi:hypothetical protein